MISFHILARALASAVLVGTCAAVTAATLESESHEDERKALRGLLAEVEQALNAHDVNGITPYLHPAVVVTYQNAEVSRGIDEVKAFYTRMLSGADAVVKDFSTSAEVSAPAVFLGNSAVAHGTTSEHYTLAEGLDFTLDTRWTATVTNDGGGWKVAALHFSSNLFDNPILAGTRMTLWYAGAAGVVLGMLLMVVVRRLRPR